MYCDFHTHLHCYLETDEDLKQIDSNKIISVACSMDIESYEKTKILARNSSNIIPTFGIHPAKANIDFDPKQFEIYAKESKIIGEIGLDFFWFKDISEKDQVKVFELFLDHCNMYRKYCVIHTKGAERKVLDILRHYPNAKPIIHWYHGPEKEFMEIVERGYYCTFGCEVKYSKEVQALLKMLPLDLLLSETDNPESEIWLGGSRKDPMLIDSVVKDIANVKGLDFEEVINIILANSQRILKYSGIEIRDNVDM